MTRVKSSVARKQRHKEVVKQCKGYFGRAKSCFKISSRLLRRAHNNRFVGRKLQKRNNRSESIGIINAFCKSKNTSYSRFINKFNKHKISKVLDRKSFALTIQHNTSKADEIFNLINLQ